MAHRPAGQRGEVRGRTLVWMAWRLPPELSSYTPEDPTDIWAVFLAVVFLATVRGVLRSRALSVIGAAALATARAMSLFVSISDFTNLYWLLTTSAGVGICSA